MLETTKTSILLKKMFEKERWENLLENAVEKGINKELLKQMSNPEKRVELYWQIKLGQYKIEPPQECLIPKPDSNEMRKVYANTPKDRIVCTLINDTMMDIYKHCFIHPSCVSYQKGIGSQDVVKKVASAVTTLGNGSGKVVGYVSDFSKFFDNVSIEAIDGCFDKMEKYLGFEIGTEPVIEMIREYYHTNFYYDVNGDLCEKYQSLKQGCAIAAMLSCMVLYELDEYMSKTSNVYYRYSDDCLTLREDPSTIVDDINKITSKYGVVLNEKKVKPVKDDEFFKFLGVNIKGENITLSKRRIKELQKNIMKATLSKKYISSKEAIRNVYRILYGTGDSFSWATSCLGTINIEEDLIEIDNFIKDSIRACMIREKLPYKKRKKIAVKEIGGLSSNISLDNKTVERAKGTSVKRWKNNTPETIEGYISLNCMSKLYNDCKSLYNAKVRELCVINKDRQNEIKFTTSESLYERLLKEVENGKRIDIDLNNKTIHIDNKKVIFTKEDYLVPFSDLPWETIEDIYADYKVSIPFERIVSNNPYFKAIPSDQLSVSQFERSLVDIPRRNVMQYLLEAYVLLSSVSGILTWADEDKFFWQSQKHPDLIIFKDWVVS